MVSCDKVCFPASECGAVWQCLGHLPTKLDCAVVCGQLCGLISLHSGLGSVECSMGSLSRVLCGLLSLPSVVCGVVSLQGVVQSFV